MPFRYQCSTKPGSDQLDVPTTIATGQLWRVTMGSQDLELDLRPPSRPAARFCDLLPPRPLPLFLPPLLEELGALAIDAARCLLMPRLRRPSYCLSSFT